MQRRGQCGLVHDAAACGVYQVGGRLHPRQRGGVDQVAGLSGERAVDGHKVGLGQQFVERSVGIGAVVDGKGVVRQDAHAEALRDARHAAADHPEADDADGESLELEGGVAQQRERSAALPVAARHVGGVAVRLGGQVQDQREGVLRHGVAGVAGHVAHRDAGATGGLQVDVVVAGGAHRHQAQVVQRREYGRGDQRLVDHDHLGAGAVLDDLRLRAVGQAVVLAQRLETGEVDVSVQADVGIIREQDAHGSRSSRISGSRSTHQSSKITSLPLAAEE